MYRTSVSRPQGNRFNRKRFKKFSMLERKTIIFLTFVLLIYYVLETCASEDTNKAENDNTESSNDEGESSIIPGFDVEIIKKPKYCMKRAKKGDMVFFHAESKVMETDIVFESSRKGKPLSIHLGKHYVSEKIESLLENLCIGDRRLYVGNYSIIFGNKTSNYPDGKVIDKSSTIMIDVEVKDIQQAPDPGELFSMLSNSGDGKISVEKLKKLMVTTIKSPEFPMDVPEGQLDALLEYALKLSDKDSDGLLSNDEFVNSVLMDNDPEGHKLVEQFTQKQMEDSKAKVKESNSKKKLDETIKTTKDEL